MGVDVDHYRRVAEQMAGKPGAINNSAAAVLMLQLCDLFERRWIPVSERLPEVDPETMLLVCVQCEDGGRSVDVARWRLDADGKPSWGDVCGSNHTIYGWSHLFVVAWMPLPEPPNCTTQPM